MKYFLHYFFLVSLVMTISNSTFAEGINFEDLTLKQGIEKAKKENKKLFIDVFATWCGPCKYLSKKVFIDQELGEFINENFIALKIDGEKGEGITLMSDYSLQSYPTMLFMDTDRSLMRKIVGAVSAEDIIAGGNAALYPETTKLFKLQKKYDNGVRDRKLISDLAIELLHDSQENEHIVAEFLKLFPQLDMENEDEFIIFCIGVTSPEDARLKTFLDEIQKHKKNHGEMVATKVIMMMYDRVQVAKEKNDISLVKVAVDELFPYYEIVNKNPPELDEFVTYFESVYNEE